jgi:hypothetical protein
LYDFGRWLTVSRRPWLLDDHARFGEQAPGIAGGGDDDDRAADRRAVAGTVADRQFQLDDAQPDQPETSDERLSSSPDDDVADG